MVLKELNLTVSTLGGCGCLARTDFKQCLLLRVWQSLNTDFNSFYFGRKW